MKTAIKKRLEKFISPKIQTDQINKIKGGNNNEDQSIAIVTDDVVMP